MHTARPGAAWVPEQRAAPSIRYEERHSPRRSRDVEPRIPQQRTPPRPRLSRRPEPVLPDSVYELGYRICADGWQEAVAWRLGGALDRRAWNALVKRPSGLCRLLADLATEIEDTAKAVGEAAGLACAEAMGWFGLPRLVQKVAQTIVAKTVPPVGEELTAALARQLRIIGIWSCVSTGGALEACPCFADLVRGHTREWIEDALTQALSGLRSTQLR